MCQKTVRLEDAFIDLAFEMGPVNGMTPKEIKKYIRYIADWRLGQLGFQPIYMIDEHPAALAGADAQRRRARQFLRDPRDRIFEGRDAGELGRGVGQFRPAARRPRRRTIRMAGRRRSAKAGGEDMFTRAGVAAE